MPKRDENGREYIKQDGKRYYKNFWGQWEAEKDWLGNDKVEKDIFGRPKIETDIFGRQKIETDWLGKPIVKPKNNDNDGGCYLTTACMRAMCDEFDDNCAELATLRKFRDTYVTEKHSEDITEYYEVSPRIVSAINKCSNCQDIYVKMYKNLVLNTITLINQGLFEKAYQFYKDYSRTLEEQYC